MKIELLHPIAHGGVEFGQGVHELPDELALHFINTAPLIVRLPQADAQPGTTAIWPDADTAYIDRVVKRQNAGF